MSSKLKAFLNTARQSDGYWIEKAKLGFAIALERWRKAKGLNNSELAQKVGVSPAYMTKVFRGDCNFTIETMVKLARACDGQLSIQIVSPSVDAKTWLSKVTTEDRSAPAVYFSFNAQDQFTIAHSDAESTLPALSTWAANDIVFGGGHKMAAMA